MRVDGIKIYNPVFGKRVIPQKPDGERLGMNVSSNPKPEPQQETKPKTGKKINYII